jgi:hypothetical protein
MSEKAEAELLVPEDTAAFISQGRSEDGNRLTAPRERSCCCPSRPAVRVLVPSATKPTDRIDLLLCGHHFRASGESLTALLATVTYFADGLS